MRRFFIVAAFLLFSAQAFGMQIIAAKDRFSGSGAPGSITLEDSAYLDQDATGTSASTAAEITVPAGSYNMLLVIVAFNNEGPYTVSSCYWDTAGANQAMTQIAAYTGGSGLDDAATTAFRLVNPTVGANKAVTVNFSGDLVYGCSIAVYALSGVDQSNPIYDYDGIGTENDATPTSVTLTTLSGQFIAMSITLEYASQNFNWTGSGFSTTELYDQNDGNQSWSSAYGFADSASELCEVAWTNTNHTALCAIAVKVAE